MKTEAQNRKLRSVQKSVEPNNVNNMMPQQPSVQKPSEQESERKSSPPEETVTHASSISPPKLEPVNTPSNTDLISDAKESPETNTDPSFEAEFEDNFEIKTENFESSVDSDRLSESLQDKPKFSEKELKVLRLELENAEYLQLKSLLQAKINSEQFEIVKLRSQFALKYKQESNSNDCKDIKDCFPEEQELRHRLIMENAELEQKRLSLISLIFQERVAYLQLKIEMAMKEILNADPRETE